MLLDIFAILDQIHNTEGVSYIVYLTGMGVILGIFITVVGFIFARINTGFKDSAILMENGLINWMEKL
jgi:hypothetical protein